MRMVMGCGCENKKLASELDRIRRLAKAYAVMERCTVVLYRMADGTYGFCTESENTTNTIIEYISQY